MNKKKVCLPPRDAALVPDTFSSFCCPTWRFKNNYVVKEQQQVKKKKKISPIPHQHNNRLFTFCCFQVYVVVCIKKCVIGRHFQKTERRQRRIIGVRLIGFGLDDEICHNFTPHRTVTRRVDEQLSRDERFSRIMSACKHHTQAQHTNNHDTRLHNTFSFFF